MAVSTPEPLSALPAQASRGWLVAPWFDLLFMANIAWPLIVLLQTSDGFAGREGVQFWQLYYITTPHRWITLLIVFLDRERFAQRRTAFLLLAAAATTLCLGVQLTTGALTCLLAVDYIWNAWHFASQHHGIYRIYGRRACPGDYPWATMEKWTLRGFLLYVILRVATATWADPTFDAWFQPADWLAALVPAGLILFALLRPGPASVGGLTYLVSMCLLYLCLLWAVHERRPGLVLSLATASALFHALEYLALVSWSVRQRHRDRGEAMGLLGTLAPRWGLALAVFIMILGAAGWLMDQGLLETWLLINVIVAFLHYAYDGLIWRRRAA